MKFEGPDLRHFNHLHVLAAFDIQKAIAADGVDVVGVGSGCDVAEVEVLVLKECGRLQLITVDLMAENFAIAADRHQLIIALWHEFKVINSVAMTVPFNLVLTGLRECLIDFWVIQITMIPVCINIRRIAQHITDLLIPGSELCDS